MEYRRDSKTYHRFRMTAIDSNMYILCEGNQALVIDPHISDEAMTFLQECGVNQLLILLTHEHFDHISGVNRFREQFQTKVLCSQTCADALGNTHLNMAKFWEVLLMDKPPEVIEQGRPLGDINYTCEADRTYTGSTEFDWCGHLIQMREAPGHSKGGSLIVIDGEDVFTGDNLVQGMRAIVRFPGGSKREYEAVTLPLLGEISDAQFVFPGHGDPAQMAELRQYAHVFKRETK